MIEKNRSRYGYGWLPTENSAITTQSLPHSDIHCTGVLIYLQTRIYWKTIILYTDISLRIYIYIV